MLDFGIRFFICNLFITAIIGAILLLKRGLKKHLSSRFQYNLWFLVLALLAVPFLPFHLVGLPQIISRLYLSGTNALLSASGAEQSASVSGTETALDWMNDFSISVTRNTPSALNLILLCIWLAGILGMLFFMIRSRMRLYRLESSALPLQNPAVRRLFTACKAELKIHREISVYSSVYIKSPFTVGILKPRIYLPTHLISDHTETDCRFILLHELQHCKHKDAAANVFMNLANIVYWFHPMIWYALKEMRNEREIACDASVLSILPEQEYLTYGNALINFAEKLSLSAFPFASGIGGNVKQIKRRIIQIASYEKETPGKKCKNICLYALIAALMLSVTPLLSVQAFPNDTYRPEASRQNVTSLDLSSYFKGYKGSFVLYDSAADHWQIYNASGARQRVSPDSTYKIYSALFALEQGLITPQATDLIWNGQNYPFQAWNADQDLSSAFRYSVNWYFQTLDAAGGLAALQDFYTDIDYGNQDLSSGVSDFWMEASLKISPLEQVELLKKMYFNEFGFNEQNVQTVKNALLLSSDSKGSLYGKTGTGAVNGQNINGWFVGYVETADTIWFFAANIQPDNASSTAVASHGRVFLADGADQNSADGSIASRIALNILKDQNIY